MIKEAWISSPKKLTSTKCPWCNAVLEGATGIGAHGPVDFAALDGKPTVCAYCSEIGVFTGNAGQLRAPTAEEKRLFESSPEVMLIVEFARTKLMGRPM